MYKKHESIIYIGVSIFSLILIELCTNWIVYGSDLYYYFYPHFYGYFVNAIIGLLISCYLFYFNQKKLSPIKIIGSINESTINSFLFIAILLLFFLFLKWLDLDGVYLGGTLYVGDKSVLVQVFLLYLPVFIGIPLYQEIIFRGFMVNAFIREEKMVVYIVPAVAFTFFYLKDAMLSPYTIQSYIWFNTPIVFCFSIISIYARLKTGGLLISIILAILFSLVFNQIDFEIRDI